MDCRRVERRLYDNGDEARAKTSARERIVSSIASRGKYQSSKRSFDRRPVPFRCARPG